MNIPRKLFTFLSVGLILSSCGLMELDESELAAMRMQLDRRDTLYVMVGDTFQLHPTFTPDSATMQQVLWLSSDNQVVYPTNNSFAAVGEGWAKIKALSVAWQLEDSCMVRVMPLWGQVMQQYPYEMIVYARIMVHGKPYDPETMRVAAFVGEEMRGEGELMTHFGVSYVRFRVGSDVNYTGNTDDYGETVTFRVYHQREFRCEEFPVTIDFDGESHGSLSSLFDLVL